MSQQYNGWANYETWCVNLWLHNEEFDYHFWRDKARQCFDEAPTSPQVLAGIWTPSHAAQCLLADELRNAHNKRGLPKVSDIFADLLRAALKDVDWQAIAGGLLEGIVPDQPQRTEQRDQRQPLFETGRIFSTPGALKALSKVDVEIAVGRHSCGDWGIVGAEDWEENQFALKEGFRLLSVYEAGDGTRFWIITEADRSATTVLLPSEY